MSLNQPANCSTKEGALGCHSDSCAALVFAAACGSPRPTFPNCFLGVVPHFGHHRLQMTLKERTPVPSHTAAIRVGIQDLKAKHLQIF